MINLIPPIKQLGGVIMRLYPEYRISLKEKGSRINVYVSPINVLTLYFVNGVLYHDNAYVYNPLTANFAGAIMTTFISSASDMEIENEIFKNIIDEFNEESKAADIALFDEKYPLHHKTLIWNRWRNLTLLITGIMIILAIICIDKLPTKQENISENLDITHYPTEDNAPIIFNENFNYGVMTTDSIILCPPKFEFCTEIAGTDHDRLIADYRGNEVLSDIKGNIIYENKDESDFIKAIKYLGEDLYLVDYYHDGEVIIDKNGNTTSYKSKQEAEDYIYKKQAEKEDALPKPAWYKMYSEELSITLTLLFGASILFVVWYIFRLIYRNKQRKGELY